MNDKKTTWASISETDGTKDALEISHVFFSENGVEFHSGDMLVGFVTYGHLKSFYIFEK